jgi:inosose dehydratase
MNDRRDFLKTAGLGLAAITIPGMVASGCSSEVEKKADIRFQLGIASYSLRNFPVEEALEMTRRLDISRIAFKDFHLPLDATDAQIADTVALCKEKEITLYGGGVIYMRSRDEVENAFRYAKAAGMDIIIGVPNHELLAYVEEKVKEYDIKLAIHNHGPGDEVYPSAESAYLLIKDMDMRMGLCVDIGHTKRINRDPKRDVKEFFDRVHDIHIKDVTAASAEGSTCEVGRGVIDIPAFLKLLIDLDYSGTVALEFEKDPDDPLAGMAESLGYIKGVLATLIQ